MDEIKKYNSSYTRFHQSERHASRWHSAFDKYNHQKLWDQIAQTIQNSYCNILEIGCAHGASLNQMHANALGVGIDIRLNRLYDAKEKYSHLSFIQSNSLPLPFKDQSFDLVFQFVTFSSIKDHKTKINISKEIVRILKPGGLFLWYDFRYPNPFNPFTTFESNHKILQYFPNYKIHLRTMTVVPLLGRWIYPQFISLFQLIDRIPLFHSHYFGWFKKD